MKPRILILGGGFAGMFAAKELSKTLGDRADLELINGTNHFVFQPLLPEVAAGSITTRDAIAPLRLLLPNVKIRQAQIYDVDTEKKIVTIFQGQQRRYTEVSYDHLVVSLGQEVDLSRFPGLSDHAITMKNVSDAFRLRNHVIDKLEHADITAMPEVKRELLTFTVIGAGFSGIETVGEMKELIDRSLKFYPNIDPGEIRVVVLEFADRVLAELPESLAQYAHGALEKRGIEIKLKTGVARATGTCVVTSDGEKIGTRTIVATIGNAPAPLLGKIGLETAHGRLAVDRTLKARGAENVWSLGDCALIPMKEDAKDRRDFAPPTAQFAVREARLLAKNLAASISGANLVPFDYTSKGSLASLGGRRGVAEVYGMRLTGFAAWLLWRAYYLGFLPGFGTKLRVLLNWLSDTVLSRNTVQVKTHLQGGSEYVHYLAGDRIFERGSRADGFYTVIEGKVEQRIPGADGEEIVRVLGPGDHFGERVLLGSGLRTGTVRAIEDTKVMVLAADDFQRLTSAFPALKVYFDKHVEKMTRVRASGGETEVKPVETQGASEKSAV
ncbi:FAD-dependent oxidoreductase [Amaricoccus macauensis]|uniref:FAD-dependent oxidoreductase n=1 Tax=Amaricoccus macauensis TaxID=57001 RepID=UPI003C7DD3C1